MMFKKIKNINGFLIRIYVRLLDNLVFFIVSVNYFFIFFFNPDMFNFWINQAPSWLIIPDFITLNLTNKTLKKILFNYLIYL
jgi:hypothetical protein